jgi:predicted transposase YbfD/YdcC
MAIYFLPMLNENESHYHYGAVRSSLILWLDIRTILALIFSPPFLQRERSGGGAGQSNDIDSRDNYSIIMVEYAASGRAQRSETRYYIASLNAGAETLADAIRQHWRVENSLHWTMDVTFRDDDCRIRTKNAPGVRGSFFLDSSGLSPVCYKSGRNLVQ